MATASAEPHRWRLPPEAVGDALEPFEDSALSCSQQCPTRSRSPRPPCPLLPSTLGLRASTQWHQLGPQGLGMHWRSFQTLFRSLGTVPRGGWRIIDHSHRCCKVPGYPVLQIVTDLLGSDFSRFLQSRKRILTPAPTFRSLLTAAPLPTP